MAESTSVTASEVPPWDEAQYRSALAHLEGLSKQLSALRPTIPSLISPLVRPHANRTASFLKIKKAATNATNDLKDFRDNWQGERTQELLARARESEKKDGDLGPAREVRAWGWREDVDRRAVD